MLLSPRALGTVGRIVSDPRTAQDEASHAQQGGTLTTHAPSKDPMGPIRRLSLPAGGKHPGRACLVRVRRFGLVAWHLLGGTGWV